MATYKFKIDIEEIIKADSEDEVLAEWEKSICDNNDTISTYVCSESKIAEVCPHCEE